LSDFAWKVRKRPVPRRFSDGLVVQGGPRGLLRLSVCRVPIRQAQPAAFGLLGPLAAACTSEGIRRDTGIISWLHWPNLVTIEGRVTAKTSVSVTRHVDPDSRDGVVFDVLVNCSAERPTAFPSGLRATSILEVLGVEIDVDLLRDKVLHAVDWYFAEWERGAHRKLVERMEPTISWLGRDVEVRGAGSRVIQGRAKGLDDDGSLLLERRGVTHAIPAEQVELVRVAD
jgi:biotin-(acetyl-CoA carboxylase) ligase